MGRFIKKMAKNAKNKIENLENNTLFNALDNQHAILEKDYSKQGIELSTTGTNIETLQKEYDEYKSETMNTLEAKAEAQNKELARAFSTHSSKSMYQTEQIASLNWYVYYLLWLYAVVAVIFLVVLFGGPNANKTSIYVKGIVTVLLLLYPFYVTTVENFLYAFYQFGLHIIYGDVYIRSSY